MGVGYFFPVGDGAKRPLEAMAFKLPKNFLKSNSENWNILFVLPSGYLVLLLSGLPNFWFSASIITDVTVIPCSLAFDIQ